MTSSLQHQGSKETLKGGQKKSKSSVGVDFWATPHIFNLSDLAAANTPRKEEINILLKEAGKVSLVHRI